MGSVRIINGGCIFAPSDHVLLAAVRAERAPAMPASTGPHWNCAAKGQDCHVQITLQVISSSFAQSFHKVHRELPVREGEKKVKQSKAAAPSEASFHLQAEKVKK